MTATPAFLTDRYELTMVDAALREGTADRECLFEAFARRLPGARKYGVLVGTGRLLEEIPRFRFHEPELEYLAREDIVSTSTIDWLANYRFSGDIWGYAEGEVYFPNSPLLTVHAGFAEGVLLETLILSILNYDSAVANAASRMVTAAKGRPLAEMGSRRANEWAAVSAARSAYIAGFDSTSNLEAGRRWGVPTMGTAAHSFTLLHDTEEDAFRAQVAANGPGTTLLVDTYDIHQGVENAVRAAGPELGAVRIDSGDLGTLVGEVRRQLDDLGAVNTKITVTNDLDEHAIAALAVAPVDSYGVGTSVVTGSGAPAAGMVYKLVARRDDADSTWVSVAKASAGKESRGGFKTASRTLNAAGIAVEETVAVHDGPVPLPESSSGRSLTVPLMTAGTVEAGLTGAEGTARARAHRAEVLTQLPAGAFRLGRGEPILPTVIADA